METVKIVFLRIDRIPINGLAELFFYTEKEGEIFLGTDNNPFENEDIERWVKEKKILKLKEPIIIEYNEMLQIGYSEEKVYISNPLIEKLVLVGKLNEIIT